MPLRVCGERGDGEDGSGLWWWNPDYGALAVDAAHWAETYYSDAAEDLITAKLDKGTGLDAESQGNAEIRRAMREYKAGQISKAAEQAALCEGNLLFANGKNLLQESRYLTQTAGLDKGLAQSFARKAVDWAGKAWNEAGASSANKIGEQILDLLRDLMDE